MSLIRDFRFDSGFLDLDLEPPADPNQKATWKAHSLRRTFALEGMAAHTRLSESELPQQAAANGHQADH